MAVQTAPAGLAPTAADPPAPGAEPTVVVGFCRDPGRAAGIAELFNSCLGAGLYRADDVAAQMADPAWTVVTVTCTSSTAMAPTLVGAATGGLAGDGDGIAATFAELRVVAPEPFGVLESAVLAPGWRGRGLGRQMVAARLEALVGSGAAAVGALSWESPARHRSRPALEALGFVAVGRLERAWEDSACPHCGPSCHCAAAAMLWTPPH